MRSQLRTGFLVFASAVAYTVAGAVVLMPLAHGQIRIDQLPSLDAPQDTRPSSRRGAPTDRRRIDQNQRKATQRAAPSTAPEPVRSFDRALERVDFSRVPWSAVQRATDPELPAGPGAVLAPLRQAVLRRYLAATLSGTDGAANVNELNRDALAAAEALARSGDLPTVASALADKVPDDGALDAVTGTAALLAGRALFAVQPSSRLDCTPFETWNNAVAAGSDVPLPIARRLFRLAAICAMATTPSAPMRAALVSYRDWARLAQSSGQDALAQALPLDARQFDTKALDQRLRSMLRADRPVTLAPGLIALHHAAQRRGSASLVIASRSAPELAAAMMQLDWLAMRTRLAASIALSTRGRLPAAATRLIADVAQDPSPAPAIPSFNLLDLQRGDPRALNLLLDTVMATVKAVRSDCRSGVRSARQAMRVAGRLNLQRGTARLLRADRATAQCLDALPRIALSAGVVPQNIARPDWHWQALVDLLGPGDRRGPSGAGQQVLDLNILAPDLADRFAAALAAQSARAERAALKSRRPGEAAVLLAAMGALATPEGGSGSSARRFEALLAELHSAGLGQIAGILAVATLLPAWPDEAAALVAQ